MLNPAVQVIPPLEGATGDELRAARVLRDRFANLIRHPALARELQSASQASLQQIHEANVRRFGWQIAEAIRAHAFADAAATTIPVGEATETEPGALALEPLL